MTIDAITCRIAATKGMRREQVEDEVMGVDEVGKLLGLSTSAVWRLLQQGEIPGAKIGGQWRVRRDDLERHFDLARSRALAQTREREAEDVWRPVVAKLNKKYPGPRFVMTRCLWCPDFMPAADPYRFTTLCSPECAAELRQTFSLLGWPVDYDLELSPIYDDLGDIEYWIRLSLGKVPESAFTLGVERDPEAIRTRWELRHERGPLRELLLLEHPLLRRYLPLLAAARMATAQRGRKMRPHEEQVSDEIIRRILDAESLEEMNQVFTPSSKDEVVRSAEQRSRREAD